MREVERLSESLRLPPVEIHARADDALANERLGTRAFYAGATVSVHPRELARDLPSMRELFGHELAHAAQAQLDRPAHPVDPRAVESEARAVGRDFARGRTVRPPSVPLPPGHLAADLPGRGRLGEEITDEVLLLVIDGEPSGNRASVAGLVIETHGGLRPLERDYPRTFVRVRELLVARFGEETYQILYQDDARVMSMLDHARVLAERTQRIAEREHSGPGQTAGYEHWMERSAWYAGIRYTDLADAIRDFGVLALESGASWMSQLSSMSEEELEASEREIYAVESEGRRDGRRQVALARRLYRTRIATVSGLLFDTPVILDRLEVQDGFASEMDAVARARVLGRAAAVCRVGERWYVYRVDPDMELDDIVPASWLQGRTDVVPTSGLARYLITSDGAVVINQGERFMGRHTGHGPERIDSAALQEADLRLLEEPGGELSSTEGLRLFRQLLLDTIFERLERSRQAIESERSRLGGLQPSPRPIRELQHNAQLLRGAMLRVGGLLSREASLSDADMDELIDGFAEIGEILEREPVAAIFVTDVRDEDERAAAPERDDIVDQLRGLGVAEARSRVHEELQERLENIDLVRRHLLENPDAVLDLTPLHAEFWPRFDLATRLRISAELLGHGLASFAGDVGLVTFEVALLVMGFFTGGTTSIAAVGLSAVNTAARAAGAVALIEQFQHARRLEAMAHVDMTGEAALVSPQEASDAEFWAWVGAGLALVAHAGALALRARHLARIRRVLRMPALRRLFRGNTRLFGQVAEELGISERALLRSLETLDDAGRAALLARMEFALESVRLRDPFYRAGQLIIDAPGFYGPATAQGRQFGGMMSAAAQEASDRMARGELRTLREALDLLAERRRAIPDPDADPRVVGVWRQPGPAGQALTQTAGERYARFRERVQQQLGGGHYHQRVERIGGVDVPLTTTDPRVFGTGAWFHTDPAQFQRMMPHLEGLYQGALRAPTARLALQRTAELHWWLAHMMPFQRGSAAVTDALTKALLRRHGIEVSRWRPGVVPDIEAFFRTREDFIRHYESFFASAPRLPRR